jgi:hypothetical protein
MTNNTIIIILVVVVVLALVGGGAYYYSTQKTDKTPTPTSTPTSTPTPISNVDCVVGEWGPCSKECGGGIQTRTVITQPSGSGTPCPTLTQECNMQKCPILAQIVRLVKPSTTTDNYLNIAEITVFDVAGNQLTIPGSNVTLSSLYQNDDYYNPSKLVDNNVNTLSHTDSTRGTQQSMSIDLTSPIAVSKLVIQNRRDCCQDRILGSTLELIGSNGSVVWSSQPISTVEQTYTFTI